MVAEGGEAPSGLRQAGAAEDPEEFLGAMTGHQQPERQPDQQQPQSDADDTGASGPCAVDPAGAVDRAVAVECFVAAGRWWVMSLVIMGMLRYEDAGSPP
ncbi:hypothetical protein GCM10017688_29680 [Streptomyces ramulosus]